MILGRVAELKYLNDFYKKEGNQLLVLYGQKYVGKTTLLKEFGKGKEQVYYLAREASEREQIFTFARELSDEGLKLKNTYSYAGIMETVAHSARSKLVLVIDEFQHMVKTGPSFMDAIVRMIHKSFGDYEVMVILSSSSIGWVENNMVQKIGESAYEISGFLKVKELTFLDLVHYFKGCSTQQCVTIYAILGSVSGLWKYFDPGLTPEENICRRVLAPDCYLREEGSRYVASELRETGVYQAILAALASGKRKLNDLYAHTGFSRAKISVYLKNLMELEIVEKVFSYDTPGRENAQKGLYRIKNHYVHFWFRFLFPHLSKLDILAPQEFYSRYVAPEIKAYVAEFFPNICREYLDILNQKNKLNIKYERSGFWVGKIGTIDIVAQDENNKTIIGLCNFTSPMMRYDDYEWLLFCTEKAKLPSDYIYLFSTGTFDEKINLEAKVKNNIHLIDLEML